MILAKTHMIGCCPPILTMRLPAGQKLARSPHDSCLCPLLHPSLRPIRCRPPSRRGNSNLRLANARAEHTLLAQKRAAEEPHLESWDVLERDHCNLVSGAIQALEASTLRLPIVGGARADVHEVQEAICSAVDVMQAMASSICSLLPKVEQMSAVASELSNVSAREPFAGRMQRLFIVNIHTVTGQNKQ